MRRFSQRNSLVTLSDIRITTRVQFINRRVRDILKQ